MNNSDDYKIYRIRAKNADQEDHSKCAWEMDQVGVWYGVWRPKDLVEAINIYEKEGGSKATDHLTNIKQQKELGWPIKSSYFHTCKRFSEIEENKDWVMVYFDDTLHLGKVSGDIKIDEKHELNCGEELFHFREVIEKKSFRLVDLPDSFRLLASAGRSNVHQHNDIYTCLLKFLAKNPNSEAVKDYFANLETAQWLDFLGPTDWESLCLGYLIIKYDYVPTGLLPGRSLSIYDLVGKTLDGKRILGQCKKTPDPYEVEENFLSARKNYRDRDEILWFWFSYGGSKEYPDHKIEIVDKDVIKKWLHTEKGKKYLKVFKGSKCPQVK